MLQRACTRNAAIVTAGVRRLASAAGSASAVRFHEFGAPENVLKLEEVKVAAPKSDEVSLQFLAAPINPADLNTVSGVYGRLPGAFPAVAGHEGVAVVTAASSKVSGIAEGDWVIPAGPGMGTWATAATVPASSVLRVRSDAPVEYAATVAVNPSTAYRVLRDFVSLGKGDVVVQNGANSAVGQAVIQLAKAMGVKTVNIVRDRPGGAETVSLLKGLGGDVVVPQSYAQTAEFTRLLADLPAPKLGLNCIGGAQATSVFRALGDGATMVTYGAMGRQPLTLPTAPFIFKDVAVRGFWMTRWSETAPADARAQMLDELLGMAAAGDLKLWMKRAPLADFAAALADAQAPYKERKVVLTMQ